MTKGSQAKLIFPHAIDSPKFYCVIPRVPPLDSIARTGNRPDGQTFLSPDEPPGGYPECHLEAPLSHYEWEGVGHFFVEVSLRTTEFRKDSPPEKRGCPL